MKRLWLPRQLYVLTTYPLTIREFANKRPIIKGLHKGGARHKCYLYESKRVDGKVRHRFIAYLGVYRTEQHFYGGRGVTYWTDGFWDKAYQELDRLQLPADERQKIELKLLEWV